MAVSFLGQVSVQRGRYDGYQPHPRKCSSTARRTGWAGVRIPVYHRVVVSNFRLHKKCEVGITYTNVSSFYVNALAGDGTKFPDQGSNGGSRIVPVPEVFEKNAPNRWNRKLSFAGIVFLVVAYAWAIVLFIPMIIAHPFVLLFDRQSRRFHDFIAMTWMRMSLWTVRVKLNIINVHNIPDEEQPVVYVANHLSYLDIFVFSILHRRIKYVSKAEIFRIPIVGWAMRLAGNIALIRQTRRSQMQTYRQMLNVLKSGSSLVVFPEGTRSPDGRLRRFKEGAFRAARQLQVPVVPITILGTRDIMPPSAWVPLSYPDVPISIVIHPSIESFSRSIRHLADASFHSIRSALPKNLQDDPSNGEN